MNVGIRKALPGDAPALGAVLSDWIDETGWMPRMGTRDEDAGFVAGLIVSASVLVLDHEGRAAGFLARDEDTIPALYLAPEIRGQGHGARLLSRAKAGRESLSLWTFRANEDAIRFYAREGFVETDRTEGENEAGLPDVQLTWWPKWT